MPLFPKSSRISIFACALVFVMGSFIPSKAAPTSRTINSGWEFRSLTATEKPEMKDWHPAQVPGVVQTDLLSNRLIPDPFFGDNEVRLQWIGLADWEYRTTFQVDTATLAHQHIDLVFEGLDTFAEVFINEQSALQADNMFRRWRVPAKTLLKPGPNTLRIVLRSPVTSMIPKVKPLPYILPSISTLNTGNEDNVATAPYTRKAPFNYGWDWGPRYITIGIWKPVRLEMWDVLRIEDFHIQQQKVTADAAVLSAELEIDASQPATATIAITQDNASHGALSPAATQTVQLDTGRNVISIPLRINSPKLWYPNEYGPQSLYKFGATVRLGKNAEATANVRTGLRSIELRRLPDQWGKSFTFVINGIPIFAKGANVIPFDSFPTRETPEQHHQILQAARDAHMNMVREWGGGFYQWDDFFETCDELGLMVWQEFMFGGDMVPGDLPFQENVREEAIQQVKRLRNHPSVVLWCGNNEIETGWVHWGDRQAFKESISPAQSERVWQDYIVMFNDILKSVVAEYGSPVPFWPSSPSANYEAPPDSLSNGDMHYWSVWHALTPIEEYTRQNPRFMSEYGFQSFPEMRTIMTFAQPGDLAIDSVVMKSHQKNHGGNERILTYMLREYPEPKDFPSFVYLSQVLQAEAIKVGAENLRRNRPRTMGSLYWQLNDCWPVASWSSIDYYGRWKALQYYARRFYNPVLISAFAHDGTVDVYVVSDKLKPATGTIHTQVLDFSGKALYDKAQEVQIPGASSQIYFSLDEKQLLGTADPDKTFLAFELRVGGETVSRNVVFFDTMRSLNLPAKPAIESNVTGSGQDYTVTLRSPVLARDVYLWFSDMDAQPSDNYFDLLPGELVSVHLKTSASLEQVRSSLRITSLVDTFSTGKADYRVRSR